MGCSCGKYSSVEPGMQADNERQEGRLFGMRKVHIESMGGSVGVRAQTTLNPLMRSLFHNMSISGAPAAMAWSQGGCMLGDSIGRVWLEPVCAD